MDSVSQEACDDIVRLAALLCATPIAAVTLIVDQRHEIKSVSGFSVPVAPYDMALWAGMIPQHELLVVTDAAEDTRFAENPLVTGEPCLRFYAGIALVSTDGCVLGSLCVIDRKPGKLTPEQETILRTLARHLTGQLELAGRAADQNSQHAEREQTESVLKLLGDSVASAVDGILIADARQYDMPILYTNAAFLSLTGYEEKEVIGHDCRFLQGAGTDLIVVRQIRDALEAGRFCRVTLLNYKKDGTPFWNDLVISPVRDAAGTLTHFIGIQHDVTALSLERARLYDEARRETEERQQAEEALRASERFSQSALDALSATIAILDGEGNILAVNQAWQQFATANPPVTKDIAEGVNYLRVCDEAMGLEGEQAQQVALGIRSVAAGERELFMLEYPCHSPQERRWFNLRATRFHGDGKARVVVSHENITVRKEAELALRESETRFRQMADTVPNIVWTTCPDGSMDYCNQRWYEYTGLAFEETLNWGWKLAIHKSDLPKMTAAFRKALEQASSYEDEFPTKASGRGISLAPGARSPAQR